MTVILSKLSRPLVSAIVRYPASRGSFIPTIRYKSSRYSRGSQPFITWRIVTVISVLSGAFFYWLKTLRVEKDQRMKFESRRQVGKAAIGGPFELVNSENKLVTSEDLKGQWVLIYFGFTNCPDICPDELEKMAKAVDFVDQNPHVPNILPVFISVDPERDTPAMVGKYVAEFSPKFVGLTGTAEQIDKVSRAYRVYYSAGPKDQDKDYIVDHSVIMFLIDPEGEFVTYFGQTREAPDIAKDISLKMVIYSKKKMEESESKIISSKDANVQKSGTLS